MLTEQGKIALFLRNLISHIVLHTIIFALVFFIISLLIAALFNRLHGPSFSFDFVIYVYKESILLIKWLISSWDQLTWSEYDNLKIKASLAIGVPGGVLLLIYIIFAKKIFSHRFFKNKEKKLYGDAHWAVEEDVKKAGLRAKDGMLLGKDSNGYYVAEGYEHALLFAPTGSGKGVGVVIPNLLFWTQSMVVHDIKLENFALTSGWRESQGQEVYVWEPSNPNGITHCYNPFDLISDKPGKMVDDVQKIGNLLITEKDFWNNEAKSLFLGVVLYILADDTKVKSFGEVVRTLRGDDFAYSMAVALDTLGKKIHPVAYMNISAFLQKADKERSGVVSTLNSALELWANPLIDAATASSDFSIADLKKKKISIYVGLTPDNITRLQKLMQIFYQQAIDTLSASLPNLKEEPYGVMFLMDEFPTLGKMEQFKSALAYLRGYRVRLYLVVQDTQQLKGTYEEAGMNSFLSNCKYRLTYAANNYETADLISKLCGTMTEKQVSQSAPKFFDLNPSSRTVNISETQRALLLPQEVIQLPRDEQIILIESTYPIKTQKIKYYQDSFFTKRLLAKTIVPTQEPYDPRAEEKDLSDMQTDDNDFLDIKD